MSSSPKRTVRWAEGYRGDRHVSPGVAYAAVEAIRKRNGGRITPDSIVDAASAQGHPLHPIFTWDDGAAARLWRMEQARRLVQSIVVVVDGEDPVREYVNVRVGSVSDYVRTDDAMKNEVERDYVLQRAQADLRAFTERYGRFRSCANLVAKISKVIDDVA